MALTYQNVLVSLVRKSKKGVDSCISAGGQNLAAIGDSLEPPVQLRAGSGGPGLERNITHAILLRMNTRKLFADSDYRDRLRVRSVRSEPFSDAATPYN